MGRIDTYPQGAILQPNSPVTLAYAQVVANQTSITDGVDLIGLSVNVVIPEGRRIRISGHVASFLRTAGTVTFTGFDIREGSTALGAMFAAVPNTSGGAVGSAIITPSAGLHTYKLTGRTDGTVTLQAAATFPSYILVEDITGMPLVTAPGSVPVGQIGYAQAIANQGSITTEVDLTGLSVNVSVASGRIIRVTGYVPAFSSTVAGDAGRISIKEGATLITLGQAFISGTAAGANTIMPQVVLSPSAGSHTYKLTGVRVSGTGTFTMNADPTFPAYILVEDITATPAAGSGAPSSTLGYAEVTASQGSITSEVDLTGLSVTVTVPAGRRIRITGDAKFTNTSATGGAIVRIKEGATPFKDSFAWTGGVANDGESAHAEVILTPSSGTHTYKLAAQTANGGTATMAATSAIPAFILVEDISGSVWPSSSQVTSGLIASEAWTTYSPTLTNITVGSGTLDAAYIRLGRTIHYRIKFVFGAGSAVGTSPTYTLPVAPHAIYTQFHPMADDVKYLDSGTTVFEGTSEFNSGSSVTLLSPLSAAAGITRQSVTATVPMTWATGDTIYVIGTYEAAT